MASDTVGTTMGDPSAVLSKATDDVEYPAWLDRDRYPFDSSALELPEGRLHVVDEGEGRPVVMIHGNPTWSFLYRHLVRGLSDSYRCIAPDLLGFGLSERPPDFSYRPASHARVVGRLFDALDVTDAVIVGHDWGGPIGLEVATRRPDAVAGLVMMNTWMWPRRDRHARLFSRFFATPLGKRLVLRNNVSARTAFGVPYRIRSTVDPSAYRHYMAPLSTPADRVGPWVFSRELVGSRGWLEDLWDRREAVEGLPALLLWGDRDPVHASFRSRWQALFPNASTVVYDDVGHFVPEVRGAALVSPVRTFLEEL